MSRRPKIVFATYGHIRRNPSFLNSCLQTNHGQYLGCCQVGDVVDISPVIEDTGVNWDGVAEMASRVEPADLIFTQAGVALPVLQRFKEICPNGVRVLQRDSTDCRTHLRLMKQAMRRHGLFFEHGYDANGKALLNREIAEYELADKIHTMSRWTVASFVENGLGHKVKQTASQVVDLSLWNRVGGKPIGEGRFTACFIGSIGIRKAILDLLAGWQIFAARHPDAQLMIGGLPDGAEPQWVHNVIAQRARKMSDGVRWLGWQSPPGGPRNVYASSDVLVTVPIEEGATMIGPEAAACGLPIIATRNAGIDLLETGVTGWEVPAEDPAALADALEQAYSDRARLRCMGEEAQRRARLQGIEAFAAGTARALTEALG